MPVLAKAGMTVLAALIALGCATGIALAAEIYVVDVGRLMSDSRASQAAKAHVAEAEKILEKGFEDLSRAWKGRPEAERRRALGEGAEALRRQLNIERQAAANAVRNLMLEEIKIWRKKTGAPLVIARENLLDSEEHLDITPAIIKAMDAREVKFSELPSVTVREPAKPAQSPKKSQKRKKGS